tara:strand:+ start:3721 stop:3975 length:255 start_codon:yes stop_codon:yes gene_type:complete
MGRSVHVEVSIHETGGDVNKLIKKFVKKVKKSKLLDKLRENRFFEKPSSKRRRVMLNKRRNAQKAERDRQKRLDKKYSNNRSRR